MDHELRFPRIVAETLTGQSLVLPDSLDNGLAIVVLVFRRSAQPIADSWTHPVARRYPSHAAVSWYEIPVLAGGWRMMSGFIDGGMRAGIPPARHEHVATFYGDTGRIRRALEIEDLDSAYPFLIDDGGAVLWCDSGWAHAKKLHELFGIVEARIAGRADAPLDRPSGPQ